MIIMIFRVLIGIKPCQGPDHILIGYRPAAVFGKKLAAGRVNIVLNLLDSIGNKFNQTVFALIHKSPI